MNQKDILKMRLHNTGLTGSPFKDAAEAVVHLGAVQAQDYAAAKWSLGLRIGGSTDPDIEKAYNDGSILRIHVMRPTWHFVLPEDAGWMIRLTGPRVKARVAAADKRLGIDETLIAKSNAAIVKALEKQKYLTREELKSILTKIGIETNVQRLAHVIMKAELDGLICSGPRRGKQFTYALLEEQVKNPRKLDREQALAILAGRYFSSHGPAQAEDFSRWSGLAIKETREALDSIKQDLISEILNHKTYWYSRNSKTEFPAAPTALLLSIYDEYTIAYADRSDINDARSIEEMIVRGNSLTSVMILDGRVAGTWNKTAGKNSVTINLNPFRQLTPQEEAAVRVEIERYSRFTGLSAELSGPNS